MTHTESTDTMTRVVDAGSVTASPTIAPATNKESVLTLIGGIWLIAGLFIDGYAHTEIIDTETEDFFTPWHAIFYSGFAFAAFSVWRVARARNGQARPLAALPPGYGIAAIGIGVFAAGGVGDLVWHSILGIEVDIDALVSPTHLLLFVGMAAILTTPARVAWLGSGRGKSWRDLGGVVGSTAITTALVAFFLAYTFGLGESWPQRLAFDPSSANSETFVAYGLGSAFVATAILIIPTLMLLRRWEIPTGAVAVIWAVPVLLQGLAFEEDQFQVVAAVLGGFIFEIVLTASSRRYGRRTAIRAAATLGAGSMWAIWLVLLELQFGVAWTPELWAGQIVLTSLVGFALALLAFPAPVPVDDQPNLKVRSAE